MAVFLNKYGTLRLLMFSIAIAFGWTWDQSQDVVLEIKALLDKNTMVKEKFLTNIQGKSIVLQFQLHNGPICYSVFDFQRGIKVFKLDVLGEPELGQKHYISMCFVTKLKKEDFIPPDAMAKLRQKTSGSVQEANDVLKPEDFETDVKLKNIAGFRIVLGEEFHRLCSGHEGIVYARESELSSLVDDDPERLKFLKSHVSRISVPQSTVANCSLRTKLQVGPQPCACKIPFTIPWYPCVVKYCKSKNTEGRVITTRCGIRSCRATHYLKFVASHPLSCHWGVT